MGLNLLPVESDSSVRNHLTPVDVRELTVGVGKPPPPHTYEVGLGTL